MSDEPTKSPRERTVVLELPHSKMCSLLGALNWARKALRNMPAGLRVPLDTLDELDDIYNAFQPAFDRAALDGDVIVRLTVAEAKALFWHAPSVHPREEAEAARRKLNHAIGDR